MNMNHPEEMLKFIDERMTELKHELAKYPHIRNDLDLHDIEMCLKREFADQASEGGFHIVVPKHRIGKSALSFFGLEKNETINIDNPNLRDQKRKELAKFKSYYLRWAKNMISEMNRTKMMNKWRWMDVKPIAQALADLKIDDKNEKFYALEESEQKELGEYDERFES